MALDLISNIFYQDYIALRKKNIIFTIDEIRAIKNTMPVVSLFLFIVPILKILTTKNVFLP